jgi:hypothetical protein
MNTLVRLVAAADEIPDTGWPYTTILQWLGAHPETLPQHWRTRLWISARRRIPNPDQYPESKVSFAACDLSKSPMIIETMIELTKQAERMHQGSLDPRSGTKGAGFRGGSSGKKPMSTCTPFVASLFN